MAFSVWCIFILELEPAVLLLLFTALFSFAVSMFVYTKNTNPFSITVAVGPTRDLVIRT